MHRTVSLDYGVALEGQVEAVLDSGEVRLFNRGDNVARMLYVLQNAEPVKLEDGRVLGDDYGGMQGVRASSP